MAYDLNNFTEQEYKDAWKKVKDQMDFYYPPSRWTEFRLWLANLILKLGGHAR